MLRNASVDNHHWFQALASYLFSAKPLAEAELTYWTNRVTVNLWCPTAFIIPYQVDRSGSKDFSFRQSELSLSIKLALAALDVAYTTCYQLLCITWNVPGELDLHPTFSLIQRFAIRVIWPLWCWNWNNPGQKKATPWLLMPWHLVSPGHQKPWYWQSVINAFFSSLRTTCDISVLRNNKKSIQMQTYLYISSEKFNTILQ